MSRTIIILGLAQALVVILGVLVWVSFCDITVIQASHFTLVPISLSIIGVTLLYS
jgi:hypothetical protein